MVNEQPPHSRPGEDALRHDGPPEEQRQIKPYQGDQGEGRVLESVAQQDHPFLQALGAGGADVLLVDDLQHAGPDIAAVGRDADGGERGHGQDHMPDDLGRRPPHRRIEHPHSGEIGQPPAFEIDSEEVHQAEGQQGNGHRVSNERESGDRVVIEGVAFESRGDADEQGKHQDDHLGRPHQQQGVGQPLDDHLRHRPAGDEGGAEVASQGTFARPPRFRDGVAVQVHPHPIVPC